MKGKYSVIYFKLTDPDNPNKGYTKIKEIKDIIKDDAERLMDQELVRKQEGLNPDTKTNIAVMYRRVKGKFKQERRV